MREEGGEGEAVAADPYAWTNAHDDAPAADDADPYAWRDGASSAPVRAEMTREPQVEAARAPSAAPVPAQTDGGEEVYAWVEEPAAPAEAKPRRRSRGRGRGRGEGAVEASSVEASSVDTAVGDASTSDSLGEPVEPTTGFASGGVDPAEVSEAAAEAALDVPETDPGATAGDVTEEDASGFASGGLDPVADPESAAPQAADAPAPATDFADAPNLEPQFEAANESTPPEQAAERLAETIDAAVGIAPDANGAQDRTSEPAPRAPDPAEVSGPPAAPRRGWWRLKG